MDVARGSDDNDPSRGMPRPGHPMATAHKLVRACGWCQKIEIDGTWQRAPIVDADPPRVTHGVCPTCHSDLLEALARHRARLAPEP